MIVSEVYTEYKINQSLQQHMLRVGAVAAMICAHSDQSLDADNVVTAALLHDLGNILKFRFDDPSLDQLYEPEGKEYWSARKQDVELEYGANEDEATLAMMAEIGVSDEARRVVDAGHLSEVETLLEGDVSGQILLYADMRVGPHGVISLAERMADIRARYVPRRFTSEELDTLTDQLLAVEEQIFSGNQLRPSEITEESTADLQRELRSREV